MAVNNGTFSATIPANCVFTLTGFTGVNVRLTNPVNGAQFTAPATIPLAATATSTAGSIALVGFYNGVTELGEATSAPYGFTWDNVPMGNYALTAVAGDTLGNVGTSAVVNVTVVGPLAQIGVTPANATVAPGGQQQFSATGADLLGDTLNPQPAFVWSVSGGGTIDGTGLFTAGSAAGGPFNVVAASGGITGEASVSVVAVSGGTIGNTKEGTSTDTMWDNGAWINAGRVRGWLEHGRFDDARQGRGGIGRLQMRHLHGQRWQPERALLWRHGGGHEPHQRLEYVSFGDGPAC